MKCYPMLQVLAKTGVNNHFNPNNCSISAFPISMHVNIIYELQSQKHETCFSSDVFIMLNNVQSPMFNYKQLIIKNSVRCFTLFDFSWLFPDRKTI